VAKRRDATTSDLRGRIQRAFGKRLQDHRKQHKMGQKALAPRLGISRTSVSNLECGLHLPSLDEVYRAACEFGVPVEKLLPNVDEIFPPIAIQSASDDPVSDAVVSLTSSLVKALATEPGSFVTKTRLMRRNNRNAPRRKRRST